MPSMFAAFSLWCTAGGELIRVSLSASIYARVALATDVIRIRRDNRYFLDMCNNRCTASEMKHYMKKVTSAIVLGF